MKRQRGPFFQVPQTALAIWRTRLAEGPRLDEHEAMKLLRDFQLPANPGRIVQSESEALSAAMS